MERIREVVLRMIRLSDEGRKGPMTEAEMLLRDRIKEIIGLYSFGKKGIGAAYGK
ncbi:MAG: hypothetical protein K2Q26_12635 [Bdellovibrionales bacterium]|nr:hypothetical protein [Bdellovibrionales bacterium]